MLVQTLDEQNLFRAYTLASAYIVDNFDDITLAESLLTFLYEQMKNNNDKLEEVTFTMICHLLGALMRARPNTKGEGLAMMEYAKKMREYQEANERMFFLMIPDFSFNSDYDEETLKFISSQAARDSNNPIDNNFNNFL